MKTVGLIVEYNPFHNGHLYHIEKAKRLTGASNVVVVMSGNYVQRGTPSIMPKHLRADMALCCGASIVLELPVCYATASAELFALGAVSLLDKLGCVDALCFGSECGELEPLVKIASILKEEPKFYANELQSNLKLGMSFPLARQEALKSYLSTTANQDMALLLESPNNILGIEYLKALQTIESSIIPITIKRQGSDYHNKAIHSTHSSASAIRNALFYSEFSKIKSQVPDCCYDLLSSNYQLRYPVYANDFSLLMRYRLILEDKATLTDYVDISEDLANRIKNQLNNYIDLKQFCELIKTKDSTYSRISRSLLHMLLNIRKEDFEQFIANGIHYYAHILGFRKKDAVLLKTIKKTACIPLLTKLSACNEIPELGLKMLNQDILASDLYESVISDKYKTTFINEYTQTLILR
ncbi:MAG: nucleotidyltransferase [Lachnospiraceae bacterium]|nr:nucleotidyltransferase [Lachnospiraceae bacterium]